jgi:hypothetical protein
MYTPQVDPQGWGYRLPEKQAAWIYADPATGQPTEALLCKGEKNLC